MIRKFLIAILLMLLVLGFLGGAKFVQIRALIAAGENPPQMFETVSSYTVKKEVWRETISAVGTFRAVQGVSLSTEVPGLVKKIHFESGESVEEGDLLLELDASTEQAQLQAAKANLQLAKLRLDRARELRERNTVAQSELDTAEAEYSEAEAQVRNIQSVIAKKRIVAPFAGRLGIRNVDLGQFLNAGASIVTLQSLDPIYLDFTLPQQRLGVVEVGMDVEAELDAYPGDSFRGTLSAITPGVEVSTRSGTLRATLSNEDGRLRPGMFAKVSVVLPARSEVLVVPATALLYAPYGDSVYILQEGEGDQMTATQKFVRVLERRGDFVAIEAGLSEGDVIASAGVFKLRNGMSVKVNNENAPEARLDPRPADA